MRCDTRSGYVAVNNALMGQPSENPSRMARREPISSMIARTSSIRCSRDGAPDILSDNPWPRLSKATTRAKFDRRRKNAVIFGYFMHEIDMRDHARNQNNNDRSFALYLIGDVDVAAQPVARLGQSNIVHLPATPSLLAILFPRVKRVNSSRRAKT